MNIFHNQARFVNTTNHSTITWLRRDIFTMMRILWTLQKFLAHKLKLVYSILRENRWIRVPDVNLIHVQYDVRQSNHILRSLWDVITVSKYTKDLVVDINTSCSYNWALNYQKRPKDTWKCKPVSCYVIHQTI